MSISFVAHPKDQFRVGDFLISSFADPQWTIFRAAIAFVKRSGTKHIIKPLSQFIERGGQVIITAGVDVGGTTVEGLEDLLSAVNDKGEIFIFHNANNSTFHPKIYLFRNDKVANLVIGSANLTEGGLFTNYEAGFQLLLDLVKQQDMALLTRVEAALDEWSRAEDGLCYRLTAELVKQLVSEKQLPDEALSRAQRTVSRATRQYDTVASMFRAHNVQAAPRVSLPVPIYAPPSLEDEAIKEDEEEAATLTVPIQVPVVPQKGANQAFIMTLQKTDVGVGQTTTGTQRRSPEIFIPLICRDFDPEFWGWPDKFVSDPNWTGPLDQFGRGKMDRPNVMMRMAGTTFPVSLWYNPQKKDVRMRSEHIRSAGSIGDILYLERGDGTAGFSYYTEIIPQGTVRYDEYIALCSKGVRNSKKQWNYL